MEGKSVDFYVLRGTRAESIFTNSCNQKKKFSSEKPFATAGHIHILEKIERREAMQSGILTKRNSRFISKHYIKNN
jgi:hypothetical protein